MNKIRVTPRLDIRSSNIIKGIYLEKLRVIGNPHKYATKYFLEAEDEILYAGSVASILHYGDLTINDLKKSMLQKGMSSDDLRGNS